MGDTLYVIPARGGSKGLPNKNGLVLNGHPLIYYSIRAAQEIAPLEDICFSSDDENLIEIARSYGLEVPFKRPDDLSSDSSTTRSVLLHAIDFYNNFRNKNYETVVLLQPTSPLRKAEDIRKCLDLYHDQIDMVVSVFETKANPYYVLYEEGIDGYLKKSKDGSFTRRQDCPSVYELNGAVYIINVSSLIKNEILQMKKTLKYVMDESHSIDIDTKLDFKIVEYIMTSDN